MQKVKIELDEGQGILAKVPERFKRDLTLVSLQKAAMLLSCPPIWLVLFVKHLCYRLQLWVLRFYRDGRFIEGDYPLAKINTHC